MQANRFPTEERRLRRMRWLTGILTGLLGLSAFAAVLRALTG